jgi:hypothetical protein
MAAGQSQTLNPWNTAATAHKIPSQESNAAATTIRASNTKTENAAVGDLGKPVSTPSGVDKSVVGQAFQVSDPIKEHAASATPLNVQ